MEWTLCDPRYDVDDVIDLAQRLFDLEGLTALKADPAVFRQHLTVACTTQLFDRGREFIAVARDGDKLLGYCWFDRGGYTTYSREEISNAKFHHCRLDLPVRTRIKLIDEMLEQHALWASRWGIPIICSTSIRKEHAVFMRLHERRGFEVNGSYGWARTEDVMKTVGQRFPKG